MATYPKQLQLFDKNVIGGNIGTPSFADTDVLAADVAGPITVNQVIRHIEEKFTGYSSTATHVRREPRFRPFDTSFGDVVVFPGVPGNSQGANELIEKMRVLWDTDRAVTNNSIGYATSVQN